MSLSNPLTSFGIDHLKSKSSKSSDANDHHFDDMNAKAYKINDKCELITPYNPVYLDELHEQLDLLDNIDMQSVAEMAEEVSAIPSCSAFRQEPLSYADLIEGLAQLTTTGVVGMTDIVETIHSEIMLRPLGRFNETHRNRWQRGVTGRVYGIVRYVMKQVGGSLTLGMKLYNNNVSNRTATLLPDKLKMLVNVINGVMGDHLVKGDNPLALPMVFYDRYGQVHHNEISGHVVILAHGLCLSYLSWHPCEEDSLGENIVLEYPKRTLLYLDYNTGRRISENGQCLASLLKDLIDNNPNITQIDLVGYSMGGLVARSALFYAEQQGLSWIDQVGKLVTIASPHNGALLERISHHVLDIIGKVPFAGSLTKLGDIRSAGIIDLRHGSIRDADWKYLEGRSVLPEEFRHPAKLPSHINSYVIAGTIAEGLYDSKATNLIGDGLVTIDSALGEEAGEHTLCIPDGHKAIFYGVNHINMQYDSRVRRQVVEWLSGNANIDYALKSRIHSFEQDDLEVVV